MKTRTGRKFKCVGMESKNIHLWSTSFTIGKIYPEVEDCFDMRLLGDDNDSWYVEPSQFELVESC